MEHPLKRQDYLTLHYLVEQAHKKYLRQSRISKQPAFNVLRVLTSFKQIFPTTPDRLYKLIMVITKNYNPQKLQQWTNAIQKINSLQIKNSHSSLHLNQSSIRHQQSRISKHQHNININSIKTYKQQLDNQIEYVDSKRSRLKFIGDFRVTEPSWMAEQTTDENKQNIMQFSNKNSHRNSQHAHLISFEPNHKDSIKQNAQKIRSMIKQPHNFSQTQKYQLPKKINPYHQITRIDNLSQIQDRQPTSKDESKTLYSQNYRTQSNSRIYIPSRTPRDHSIIRGICLDSKDSDIFMRKSELVHPQKPSQILEYQDYNMTLEEWESLNDRTITFYEFNTKLKAFSALLANYQAFQCDRFLKNKADVFHACYLETKVFIALKNNVQIQQVYKDKLNRAQHFHNKNLFRKAWKVLHVLKNLKIHRSKKALQIQRLNRINYEFLLAFMFEEKFMYENSAKKCPPQEINQGFNFQRKAQYFSKTHNFQNVWDIYKCFGLNISISKQQLTKFFTNYHNCLKKNIFSLLKKNIQSKKNKYLEIHDKRLIEKTFSILISRKQVARQFKEKYQIAECYANRKLKQKAYKILLSIVYSTKIFSKRQQFIQAQKVQKTKIKVFKKWMTQYKLIQLKKKVLSQRLSIFCDSVDKFLLKVCFSGIQQESTQVEKRINECQKKWQQVTMRKVVKHFSTLIRKKKKYMSLCESNQIVFQKKMLGKWLRIANISDGMKKIGINCNKLIYRRMYLPLVKTALKEFLMSQEEQKSLVKECFQSLKQNLASNLQKRNLCISLVQKSLFTNQVQNFICALKTNCAQNIRSRKQQQIKIKLTLLQNYLNKSSQQKVYIQFKGNHYRIQAQKYHQLKLKSQIRNNSLFLMMRNVLQQTHLKHNTAHLVSQIKYKQSQHLCFELKRNLVQKRQLKLKLKLNQKLISSFTSSISLKHKQSLKLREKSQEHFRRLIQKRVLFSLAQNFIDICDKNHLLQQTLQKSRKKGYFTVFINKTKKQVDIREKYEKVQKIQPFSCLRENLKFKTRQKLLIAQLKSKKLEGALEMLSLRFQTIHQQKRLQFLQTELQRKLFWMRFNEHFIKSLFEKKHIFMSYKFRALKLYGIAFKSWKHAKFNGPRQNTVTGRKFSKQNKKQRFINIREKQQLHMHKPTNCS